MTNNTNGKVLVIWQTSVPRIEKKNNNEELSSSSSSPPSSAFSGTSLS